jgi:P27 family predicted phage terminase small subunit
MATPGPKPKPTHLKILHGNPGGRALNKNEPKPRAKRPSCPRDFSDDAKKAWRSACTELEAMGMLHSADRELLIVFCEAVAQHRQACRAVRTAGVLIKGRSAGVIKNPACQIVRDSAGTITRVAAELGLSPSARSRLSVPTADEDDLTRKYLS